MNWARVAAATQLRHVFAVFPPSDHWAQVTMQLTSQLGTPGSLPGEFATPYFIWLANWDGLRASSGCSPTPCPTWDARLGTIVAAPELVANTPITVGYHTNGGGTFDWYINGVFIGTSTSGGGGAFNYMFLNNGGQGGCCQVVYYTDVRVGTSQGASDLFADDFSAGNLNNWYIEASSSVYPVVASIVSAPADDPCASLAVTPTRAGPNDPVHLSGIGFTPGAPVQINWQQGAGINIPQPDVIVPDGLGRFEYDMAVPLGTGTDANGTNFPAHSNVVAVDAAGRVACTTIVVCTSAAADGIRADWDNPVDQNPTNTPDPLVAFGGTVSSLHVSQPQILDYIFHDGNHWVLWGDPSIDENAGTFPPPANHTLNATCISPDGSSVVDYPMDTGYAWQFGDGSVSDPGLGSSWDCGSFSRASPVWSHRSFFSNWSKPIYDAHFASDGSTLWVGVVTAETVPYPWIDNKDAHSLNPGGAEQATPLDVLTSGFTVFETSGGGTHGYLRYYTNPTGPLNVFKDTAFPLTDAGILGMGVWNPPVVVMFSFNGSGFDRIGEIAAKYCPSVIQQTDGYNQGGSIIGGIGASQPAPRGTLYGRVAMAASENDPGICHVVWSEGGDWGRVSDGDACGPTGPFGGTRFTWDGGPPNRSYRVSYSTWSPSAKLTDDDIFESHIDRTAWYFTFDWGTFGGAAPDVSATGYTWPDQAEFGALLNYELRNDNANGDVLLFTGVPQAINDPNFIASFGDPGIYPWLDNTLLWCDTLHVFDITGGTAVLKQSISLALMPDETETDWAYPPSSLSNQPDATPFVTASDMAYLGPYPYTSSFDPMIARFGVQAKGFGISDIYEDPLLGGEPVYLVHVPWARRYPEVRTSGGGSSGFFDYGNFPMRGFYRVPADMSGTFDFLDGKRLLDFTLLGPVGNIPWDHFDSGDFFSDPDNIWVPSPTVSNGPGSGPSGLWFDRICASQWQQLPSAETPSDLPDDVNGFIVGYAACHGHHYDPVSDSISNCSPVTDSTSHIFAVEQLFICRGCRHCRCGVGVHIARRI
jgi:hypothetical protein